MALTSSDVYSPQTPGLATVLGSGLGPLRVLQTELHRQQLAHDRAAKLQAEKEKQFNPPKLDVNGSQWFQPEIDASAAQTYKETLADYITKPRHEAKAAGLIRQADHNGLAHRSREIATAIDKVIANAQANNLNEAKVRQGMHTVLTDATTDKPISARDFDTAQLATFNENPEYFNEAGVIQCFLKTLAQKQESEFTQAARPGRPGMAYSVASNIFANDGRGKTLYTLDTKGNRVPKIANIQALEQAALQDPQMAALLRRNLERGQQPTAALLMGLSPEHVTDDQLEALNAQTDQNTPHERQIMADLLRPFATLAQKQRELSPLAVRQSRAGAGQQLKAGQATATPTSDFGLSVGDSGALISETVSNPKKGGLLNFLTPKVQRATQQVQAFDNHYPHTGVSFATEKTPYVPLVVDSNELTTLGADGTPSHYSGNKTNSQVKLNATDRSFVLEVNGKRLGLNKAGTSADAYQEMRKLIDDMTPAQARQAVMRAYYHGSVVDKGAVSGDGTGGEAKLLGYKGYSGRLLTEAEAAASKRAGEALTPVYDTKEQQVKVMRPATAQLDAQAARQTPGYNPRQRTPQEADLIQRLEAKGGRVVDPYHTTDRPTRPAFIPTKNSNNLQQPADRSGGMFETLPPRVVNGIEMTGGRDVLNFGRGGSVYKAPKKKW